jgi:hypothetical protein
MAAVRGDEAVGVLAIFGSYARGDFGRKSDLDLLVVLRAGSEEERRATELRATTVIAQAELSARLPMHLAPLVVDGDRPEQIGSALLHELWTDAVILHATGSALALLRPVGLVPWTVVRFSLKGAAPSDRVRLARQLHGLRGRPGTIRLPGLNLARGAALVPAEQSRAVRDALDDAGATYDLIPVWREA